MRVLLFVLALLALLTGVAILSVASSAIHEIEAFILFVCTAVLLTGAAVVEAVTKLGNSSVTNSDVSLRVASTLRKPVSPTIPPSHVATPYVNTRSVRFIPPDLPRSATLKIRAAISTTV